MRLLVEVINKVLFSVGFRSIPAVRPFKIGKGGGGDDVIVSGIQQPRRVVNIHEICKPCCYQRAPAREGGGDNGGGCSVLRKKEGREDTI